MIPPIMRERKRYVLFEIKCENRVSAGAVRKALHQAILEFIGEHGSSLAAPKFIGYDEERRLGILRCFHRELWRVRVALALVSEIEGNKAAIRVKDVSGILKKLKERAGLGRKDI